MEVQELKNEVCRAIDGKKEEIFAIGEDIRTHPELGFKEFRTAKIVADCMDRLKIPYQSGIAVTGVKGILPGAGGEREGGSGPTAAYLGELDSIIVSDHPDADPDTGAAHACGHNAQIASLIALAYGFVESGVMTHLGGNIALMAVPAEEYVEIDYRLRLKEQGELEFLGGKPEMIRLGAFDDVQIALMTHLSSRKEKGKLAAGGTSNGCVVKLIRYLGRAAHAGGGPHEGINALKAATVALTAIDANRETFKDDDHIRVHPIITKGGELVNVIPAEVTLETFVRGAGIEAIAEAAEKVDRCFKAGALALQAEARIRTLPGYLPKIEPGKLVQIYRRNAVDLVGEEEWWDPGFSAGSTDMGDVSHLMPALEASARGAKGTGHGRDYLIDDPETAYILPAKAAAMTLIDLLADRAAGAHELLDGFQPSMTKEEYLRFLRSMDKEECFCVADQSPS
jgi:amidohydrolase